MSEITRRKFLPGMAMLPLAGKLLAHADDQPPALRKFAPRLSGREMMRQRYFPNFELITQEGKKVRFYDDLLKDKIVILQMMYADCQGVCPTITANLKRVQKLLKEEITQDVHICSLTTKPEQDTPAKLKEYAKMHGIEDKNWLFLTGDPMEMDRLRHSIGFADPNPEIDKDKLRHSGMIRYGNEPMAIWGTCQGSGKPEWIAQEIGFAIPRNLKRHPKINE
ncbi:MAG: SCO family protein [Candidatus Angelobacter sp. Gp1-AA117]|nr:MAG: SCO family protein [Candidatus Angelobacter sp. Gp1-AA117]